MSIEPEEFASTPSRGQGTTLVIVAGLVTTAAALAASWWLAGNDINLMGWYLMFIIPAGAIIVGLVAGSGYCIASWLLGVRVTGVLLWGILALQITAYFEAQYLEFQQGNWPIGFVEWFDATTRAFAFDQRNGKPGEPLGAWGYAFRLLELGGFASGGLIASLVLGAKPYCDRCRVYMRTQSLCLLPAGVKPRNIKKNDTEGQQAYEAELTEALGQGQQMTEEAIKHAAEGSVEAFRSLVAAHRPNRKEIEKQTTRIDLSVSQCPQCQAGFLKATVFSGHGEGVSQEEICRVELAPEFVRECGVG